MISGTIFPQKKKNCADITRPKLLFPRNKIPDHLIHESERSWHRLHGQSSKLCVEKRFFFLNTHPDWPWGPPNLLYKVYRGCFPGVERGVALATHSHLAPTLRTGKFIPLSPLPCASNSMLRGDLYL
jgi:hypothetical protein